MIGPNLSKNSGITSSTASRSGPSAKPGKTIYRRIDMPQMPQTTQRTGRTETAEETVSSLLIRRELLIAAPIKIVFESVLEELGPGSVMQDGTTFSMKEEQW